MPRQTSIPAYKELMSGVESEDFYQTPNFMALKAIHARLTGADWALWTYLQVIDPHGERMNDLPPISNLAKIIGVSERQVSRSLEKLKKLELYYWEPVIIRGQNLAGKAVKELCKKKKRSKEAREQEQKKSVEIKMTTLSSPGQPCPQNDNFVIAKTTLSSPGQLCLKQELEPLLDNNSSATQTIQTYTDFKKTLSDEERENFLNFVREKTKDFSPQLNDLEGWLAKKNEAEQNRWEVYYDLFRKSQPELVQATQNAKWENHTRREEWLTEIEGTNNPLEFAGSDQEKLAFVNWCWETKQFSWLQEEESNE